MHPGKGASLPSGTAASDAVTQICNLLYRRFSIGRPPDELKPGLRKSRYEGWRSPSLDWVKR